MSPRLAALLGYDPHRVADLRPELQRALALSALSAFPGIALLAASAAYGAFLASNVAGLSLAVGAGAGLYLLNLLRVAVAGGGVGPQQTLAEVTHWRPRTVPLVMLALLGLFFAQPLILGLLSAEQDPRIEVVRRSLALAHATGVLRSVAEEQTRAASALATANTRLQQRRKNLAAAKVEALRAEVERATAAVKALDAREAQLRAADIEPYQRHLATSHFLLRRVQLTWDQPVRPVLLSALMVLLMVLPWFTSGTLARTASRAYEARRWKMNRALIDASYRESRRLEAEALEKWPAFAGLRQELYEDAPYNTRARAGAGAFEAQHG